MVATYGDYFPTVEWTRPELRHAREPKGQMDVNLLLT